MKHKHYEMIVAKAANMDLVKFIRMDGEWENAGLSDKFISFSEEYDYFLCLPQHKEACLHWLNGGDVESLHKDYEPMTLAESGSIEWSVKSTFMKDSIKISIKPKKEKRWIGVHPLGRTTPLGKTKKFVSDIVLHQMIDIVMPFSEWQFIEIEVEV